MIRKDGSYLIDDSIPDNGDIEEYIQFMNGQLQVIDNSFKKYGHKKVSTDKKTKPIDAYDKRNYRKHKHENRR